MTGTREKRQKPLRAYSQFSVLSPLFLGLITNCTLQEPPLALMNHKETDPANPLTENNKVTSKKTSEESQMGMPPVISNANRI
jgi:hypothetical protein